MIKTLVLLLACMFTLGFALPVGQTALAVQAPAPIVKDLDVQLVAQLQTLWCWAASSQMVMQYKHRSGSTDISQCRQATVTLGSAGTDCCNTKSADEVQSCNHTNWPDFPDFHFTAKATTDSDPCLTWEALKAEIDADRPVLFSIAWPTDVSDGGGHMGVVYGYEVDGQGNQIVHIYDPLPVAVPPLTEGGRKVRILYEQYKGYKNVAGFPYPAGPDGWLQDFTHWRDYYEITPVSGN